MFFNFLGNKPVVVAFNDLGKIRLFENCAHPKRHHGMVVDDEYPQLRHDVRDTAVSCYVCSFLGVCLPNLAYRKRQGYFSLSAMVRL